MSAIIPFDFATPVAKVVRRESSINRDVIGVGGPNYPVLSIKGKVFALVKGDERKLLTREVDGEEEAVQSLQITVARANTKYRVFYAKKFTEETEEVNKPTCFSMDGVVPDSSVVEPQSKKCQGCSKNVWGVRDGKGYECNTRTRLAVVDPLSVGDAEPFLLNVPPASRKSFAAAVEMAEDRGLDYNELVMKISFDKEAATPKLIFKPVGKLADGTFAKVQALYDNELVRAIVGINAPQDAAPAVDSDELDAAIAADKAVTAAKASLPAPKKVTAEDLDDAISDVEVKEPKAAPAKAEKPAPKPKAAAKKVAASDDDDLLGDLDSLLSATDD